MFEVHDIIHASTDNTKMDTIIAVAFNHMKFIVTKDFVMTQ